MSSRGSPMKTLVIHRRATDEQTMPIVRVVGGQGTLRYRALTRGCSVVLGRDEDVDIPLPKEITLSRQHAVITNEAGQLWLEDLGSTNGSWVSGEVVTGRRRIEPGEAIRLGDVVLRVDLVTIEELANLSVATEKLDRADYDPLTGLRNRRWVTDALPALVERWLAAGKPVSALMVDIDHFKRVNDTFGHGAGDEVLKKVAQMVLSSIRETDAGIRLGGEEFLVVLPRADEEQATWVAERIRRAMRKCVWQELVCGLTSVTASVGVAQLHEGEAILAWHERADKALYAAKNQGRNRTEVSSELEN
jgi:diguanylate cyclase (GGDEF)-like protein